MRCNHCRVTSFSMRRKGRYIEIGSAGVTKRTREAIIGDFSKFKACFFEVIISTYELPLPVVLSVKLKPDRIGTFKYPGQITPHVIHVPLSGLGPDDYNLPEVAKEALNHFAVLAVEAGIPPRSTTVHHDMDSLDPYALECLNIAWRHCMDRIIPPNSQVESR